MSGATGPPGITGATGATGGRKTDATGYTGHVNTGPSSDPDTESPCYGPRGKVDVEVFGCLLHSINSINDNDNKGISL